MGVYKIGVAARLSGLSSETLRTWEKRYRLVVPGRSPGGQRLYSREQVQQLRLIKRWVDVGLSASEAHEHLREHLSRHTESREAGTPDDRASSAPTQFHATPLNVAALRRQAEAARTRARNVRTAAHAGSRRTSQPSQSFTEIVRMMQERLADREATAVTRAGIRTDAATRPRVPTSDGGRRGS